MSIAYCKNVYGNKYEMFIVNPSRITQNNEDDIVYKITKISSRLCDKIGFMLDIKTEVNKLDINN